jgi:hypothetical protein
MSTNVVNQVAYLRTSRDFPYDDARQLSVEVNKAYVDTSNAINNRIISIFPTNRPAINGESWFITGNQRQQGFRQIYSFTTTANIPHGVTVIDPSQFIRCFGSYTDGTNTYGLIFGSNASTIAGQISFYLTATNIVFEVDGGAPSVTKGTVVLEWISQP